MLGGGHVCGHSLVEAWRCPQAENGKHLAVDVSSPHFNLKDKLQAYKSPKRRDIETKPSIASVANSVKFGDELMIRA